MGIIILKFNVKTKEREERENRMKVVENKNLKQKIRGLTNKKVFGKLSKGITLIALVITIIVLLILAGVSIATLTGENGILTRAQEAKTNTEQAEEEELRRLTALEAATNLENTTHTDSSTGEEKTVTIPAGFAVSQVEGENTIAEGLVVIDKDGNEFVWIPVDGILGEDGLIEDVRGSAKKILLGRYEFAEITGIPSEYSGSFKEENIEDTNSLLNYGNAIAKNLKKFIDSVRNNNGFYIARYEASKNSDNKIQSKYNQIVWGGIKQQEASVACNDLYSVINSDLINSYAWDTTILFIQKYGKSNYSKQNSLNNSIKNTGLTGDVQLNIYDMSSNCREWTTESSGISNAPCVQRGGSYNNNNLFTSYRNNAGLNDAYNYNSFRYLLYL